MGKGSCELSSNHVKSAFTSIYGTGIVLSKLEAAEGVIFSSVIIDVERVKLIARGFEVALVICPSVAS